MSYHHQNPNISEAMEMMLSPVEATSQLFEACMLNLAPQSTYGRQVKK